MRSTISKEDREKVTTAIFQKFKIFLKSLPNVKIIAGYIPIKDELDLLPLLKELQQQNYQICAPVIKEEILEFRIISSFQALKPSQFFNILEPKEEEEQVIPDLMLTPLLACDRQGYRLGYGKGYYDKTIKSIKKHGKLICVGLAHHVQLNEQLPYDENDQKLDVIITDKEIVNLLKG